MVLLAAANCAFVITVPGADDIMLNYQSLSFHDALFLRSTFGLKPAPEFCDWLARMNLLTPQGRMVDVHRSGFGALEFKA
jgi:ethanolamine ammonia-lyase large subunit